MGLQAWPLRPLFLDEKRVQDICCGLKNMLERFRQELLGALARPRELQQKLHLGPETLAAFRWETTLHDPDLLSAFRPDGFLYEDRYLVSEFNVGGGLMATLAYTELLHDLLYEGPVQQSLAWGDPHPGRPFQAYLKLLGRRLQGVSEPTVALLMPSEEKDQVYDWEYELFFQLFDRAKIRHLLVDERELYLDGQGALRETSTDHLVHAVIALTTGECYLPQAQRLQQITEKLSSKNQRHVTLHPYSCLGFGKGCLPWLSEKEALSEPKKDSFPVELASSHWPDQERGDEYRLEKERWVLKKAWSGKNTFVGCSSHGRVWNRALGEALSSSESILQEYTSLPKIVLPCLIEGRSIERIPVRFELSPFIIDGDYAGALVRYAPDMEGLVLSPSPADLGITIVIVH